jgi:phosphoenolpyruvate carboxykinase (GTP)
MAMLPFCGYNMGDYFGHWLKIGATAGARLPKIFYVNWFRQDEHGKFMWPGFGENCRVLKWIFERMEGTAEAVESAIGLLPSPETLDLNGLDMPPDRIEKLLKVDLDGWLREVPLIREYFRKFGKHLPPALWQEVDALEERLEEAKSELAA